MSASLKTGVACSQGPRSPWARSVPLCFSKTVAHRYPVRKSRAQKAAKNTKTDQELGFCHDPALPKEWGPRNTPNGMTGVGWEAHVTSRDPTLDAVGTRSRTRSCAIRRGMSKKRATAKLRDL